MFKTIHIILIILSILFCVFSTQTIDQNVQHAFFFLLLGTLWAALEVQIEGEHGWATQLPTSAFFGTHFTWYHVIMNAMVFVIVFQVVEWSLALPFWLSGLFLIEDYMWFMINPAYGITNYSVQHVHWHVWFLYMPIGNWVSIIIMLVTSSIQHFEEDKNMLFVMTGVILGYLLLATIWSAMFASSKQNRTVNTNINF